MGRFADIIRCHILEEYMASYMRERGADAMLVLRNENKWAMTGNYFDILFQFFLQFDFFSVWIRFSECDFLVFSFFSR
jgi:hypothetical protein